MKRKRNKKLALNRETIRDLADSDLDNVVGAQCTDACGTHAADTCNPQTGNSCICSCLCSIRTCPP